MFCGEKGLNSVCVCYYELKVVKKSTNKLIKGKKGAFADAGGTTVPKDNKPDADGRKR